jgi:hypothetical protein
MGVDWLVGCWVTLEIRGNMGWLKSEHWDFKKAKERTWDSACLRAKTLREIKENMGQSESKERDFKEQERKTLEVRF